jgi:hypothetical protein
MYGLIIRLTSSGNLQIHSNPRILEITAKGAIGTVPDFRQTIIGSTGMVSDIICL